MPRLFSISFRAPCIFIGASFFLAIGRLVFRPWSERQHGMSTNNSLNLAAWEILIDRERG